MIRRSPGNLERFLVDLWRFKTTPSGKRVLLALGVGLFVCSASFVTPLYHLMLGLIILLFVAAFVGWVLRPRLTIEGNLPVRACAGEVIAGRFVVSNPTGWPAYDVSIGLFGLPRALERLDEETQISCLGPGESMAQNVRIRLLRRGMYDVPRLRPYSTFPFNLFRSSALRRVGGKMFPKPDTVVALPRFQMNLEVDVPLSRRYQPGGMTPTLQLGESPEYVGNREYRPGDPLRRIDYVAWGRLTRPVVKEYHDEYFSRVAMVLDTHVPGRRRPGPDGFPNVEAAVSLTASIANGLSADEHVIDIFAAGPHLYTFRAGRQTAYLDSVLEILAGVEPCRTDPFVDLAPALMSESTGVSSMIFVFLDWDESRARLARATAEMGRPVKLVFIREGKTTLPVHDAWQWAGSIVFLSPGEVLNGLVPRV